MSQAAWGLDLFAVTAHYQTACDVDGIKFDVGMA